jgi:hypothetical protein
MALSRKAASTTRVAAAAPVWASAQDRGANCPPPSSIRRIVCASAASDVSTPVWGLTRLVAPPMVRS